MVYIEFSITETQLEPPSRQVSRIGKVCREIVAKLRAVCWLEYVKMKRKVHETVYFGVYKCEST